jgi:hypothetical protein
MIHNSKDQPSELMALAQARPLNKEQVLAGTESA